MAPNTVSHGGYYYEFFIVLIQNLAIWARHLDPTLLEITGADLILT